MSNGEEKTLSMVQTNVIREYAERYLVFNVNILIDKFTSGPNLVDSLKALHEGNPEVNRMPSEREIRDIMVDVLAEALRVR